MNIQVLLHFWLIYVSNSHVFQVKAESEQQPAIRQRIVSCEPILKLPLGYWLKNYNFTFHSGFRVHPVYLSKQIYPDAQLGAIEKIHGDQKVARSAIYSLTYRKAGSLPTFRENSYTITYSFHAGDSMVIHLFNKKTGSYEREELGVHSLRYFRAIEPGNIWKMEFPKHGRVKNTYALVGALLLRGSAEVSTRQLYSNDEMKSLFPQHSDVIENIPQSKMEF